VSDGIDHAGLVALRAPRPTLLGTARFDFFPIEGARESFAEAQKLYEVAGAGERIARVEAAEKHGLTLPLRKAVYEWFDRWLAGREHPGAAEEIAVEPRSATELRVCAEGQVSQTFRSRPLLSLALEEFRKQQKPAPKPLRDLLSLDPKPGNPHMTEVAGGTGTGKTLVLCINGNETPDWREEREFLQALARRDHAVVVVDPRGMGTLRPDLTIKGHDYADPLSGVEENIAYNAFLVGQSLLGLRVSDVLAAVTQVIARTRPKRLILCGRRDAALVACFAAAVEPAVQAVATEEMLKSFLPLLGADGYPINAASILPGLLRDFGDIPDVLTQIAPRRVLVAAGLGENAFRSPSVQVTERQFTKDPSLLMRWIQED
jgi:pimeloyl-ACP methyl ester carboxylesterase